MTPQNYSFAPIVAGHTWSGFSQVSRVDSIDGGPPAPPASALASVEMAFTQAGTNQGPRHTLTSDEDGGITITSAEDWQFTVPKQILPLTAGRWDWMLTTVATDGTRDPLLYGTLEILRAP